MRIGYKRYVVDIIDDSNYTLNSADNIVSYDNEYSDGTGEAHKFYPTSKHGVRVSENGNELASAVICEVGGKTAIHKNSLTVVNDSLLICCSDKVYALSLPDLKLRWRKRFDPATCFAIYPFMGDFIIHGELQITRIDSDGNEKWHFTARDIWVTPDGAESIELKDNRIKLKDWEGYEYELDSDGHDLSLKRPSNNDELL